MVYVAQRSFYCLYCTESLPTNKRRSMSGLIITTMIHIAPSPTWSAGQTPLLSLRYLTESFPFPFLKAFPDP